jgi:hypothetical protein
MNINFGRLAENCRRFCSCKISQFQQDSTSSIFQMADFKRLVRGRDRGPEPDFAACCLLKLSELGRIDIYTLQRGF